MTTKNDGSEMNQTESIFAFVSWLTTRNETSMFSRRLDAAPACDLIKAFLAENPGMPECRDGYTELYELPEEETYFQV